MRTQLRLCQQLRLVLRTRVRTTRQMCLLRTLSRPRRRLNCAVLNQCLHCRLLLIQSMRLDVMILRIDVCCLPQLLEVSLRPREGQ